MKKLCNINVLAVMIVAGFMFQGRAFADPGVVIDAKGGVAITQSGKTLPAKTGAQFSDGAIIDVAKGGVATLMFSNGAMKKLSGGEKFTVAKTPAGQPKEKSLIKGIAMAYNDATRASAGPTVHGMVKAMPTGRQAAPGQEGTPAQEKLDPERQKLLQVDLKQVDSMGLSGDGKALIQAQVYYKYQQYQKCVNLLLPVYKSQNPPADMVKNLIAVSYERMGKTDEAGKYK